MLMNTDNWTEPFTIKKILHNFIEEKHNEISTTDESEDFIEKKHIVHSENPLVETYNDILTPDECQHFIDISKESLKRALVSSQSKGVVSSSRTGSNTWIDHNHDKITKSVTKRIAKLVGLPLENAEKIQIIYYGVSEEYRNHYDSWVHDGSDKTLRCMKYGGARLKTALCYLNDVEEGGGTKMTKLDITIEPKKGKLLIFQNTISEVKHNQHPLSEHAGLPVKAGEKYAFNLWFRECKRYLLYKEINPDYYNKTEKKVLLESCNKNTLSLQLDINKLSNNNEIYSDIAFIDNDICNKILELSNFNTNTRRDAWIKLDSVSNFTEKLELLLGINKEFFENINVVEYKPGKLHNKHFIASDLNSEIGKKYTNILGQRLYTVSLALSDNIVIDFPNDKTTTVLNNGDILVYNNVQINSSNRNPNLERTIINNNSSDGYIANIYIRHKTKNGKTLIDIESKQENIELQITKLENYIDTFNTVMNQFKNDKVTQEWNGFESFKYNFKGNFDKFKDYIKLYNTIRESKPCLNSDNLEVNYVLNPDLPIQIVNNVIDKELLSLLQKYYKDTIGSNTWKLGDKQSNRYKAHNEPMSRFLHYEILPLIEKIVGKSLKPTYTYLSAYTKGADLPPHTDRPDCEYTVSFVVDKPEDSNWNIYVHKLQQPVKHKGRYDEKPLLEECEAVDCEAGGLMLFQGTDHIHFREELEYDYYNVLLLHYCSVKSTYN